MFRWLALAVFLATLGISAGCRRQARRAGEVVPRSEEPAALIAGRLLVAMPLFGGVVAYLANPAWMQWASMEIPRWARWAGAGLGFLAVPSAWLVLAALGTNVSETVLTKPRHRLVTTGPYHWVRHPLYAVSIALFLGIALMAANWFILLWTLIALAAVRLVIIPREEAHLVTAFGDDYRVYRRRTGSLLPSMPSLARRFDR